ncbi:MAG: M15 family metallopeptidase [Halioglobus sp.]|nr:M15 family metallopeptidase [Halioglobus sp.]
MSGLDESHLVAVGDGQRLREAVAAPFTALRDDARRAGFDLAIASGYRSYHRQLAIWNAKATGARAVHDDDGRTLDLARLAPAQRLHAILRFSAIPGTSRHHWGTDLDVYDAAAVPPGYAVQLSPREVAAGGIFGPLHHWLDQRMAAGRSHGFFRPYGVDRGGVAPERWHLSYAPLAVRYAALLNPAALARCWDCAPADEALQLRAEIERELAQIIERYVLVPDDWLPSRHRV